MSDPGAVATAVAQAHQKDWALVLAATLRATGDLSLAEDCVQEAYAAALDGWVETGIPRNPAAWLTTTARRRAVDAIRRGQNLRAKVPLLIDPSPGGDHLTEDAVMATLDAEGPEGAGADVGDERLRLIFLCCHPALAQESQLALTLRLVCGVETPDIARALLVSTPTMAARLTRAKKKIAGSRIPFRMPPATELPDRLRAVLGVVHLLFTSGHTAPSGVTLTRDDLVESALQLGRMLLELMPDEPEVRGLLALMMVTHARRSTRTDDQGRLVRLEHQDRSQWDRDSIAAAEELITSALRSGPPGRYAVQAAIASLYAEPHTYAETDWTQILILYDRLLEVWPSPVVALNRIVALSMTAGPSDALRALEAIAGADELRTYPYRFAIRADLLRRLGREDDAQDAYRRALDLTTNEPERQFLLTQLTGSNGPPTNSGAWPEPTP